MIFRRRKDVLKILLIVYKISAHIFIEKFLSQMLIRIYLFIFSLSKNKNWLIFDILGVTN